jgi:glycosyltransferase involved in cell wall biosynthesis
MGPSAEERCPPYESVGARGVELVELRIPPRRYWTERRWVARRLERAPATVLHSHGYHADLVAWLATGLVRRPVVATAHGFTGGGLKNRLYEWLDRAALRRFSAVVAVSDPLGRSLRAAGIPAERVHVIPSGWAPNGEPLDREAARAALHLPTERRVVGWVGRLTAEKGAEIFLAAGARLREEPPLLSIIGDGPQRRSLAALATQLGLDSRIRWHGQIAEAARLLRAFDAVVLSSWTEGTPMILLEAISAGVPVVSTAVGGIPDVVGDREALLVPPGDPPLLAEAIRRCLDERALTADRIGAARKRLAERFAGDRWLEQYETVYRAVL